MATTTNGKCSFSLSKGNYTGIIKLYFNEHFTKCAHGNVEKELGNYCR